MAAIVLGMWWGHDSHLASRRASGECFKPSSRLGGTDIESGKDPIAAHPRGAGFLLCTGNVQLPTAASPESVRVCVSSHS